jgi:hypothetical protein
MDNKALNYMNIARNSFGRRRINIYLPHDNADALTHGNSKMVYLNSDMPGDAVNVKLMYCHVDAVTAQPFFQVEFNQGVHTQNNITYNCRASCMQVLGDGSREKVPMRFNSDHIPQNFKLSIYNPGEPATLVDFGNNGALLIIEFDYVAN